MVAGYLAKYATKSTEATGHRSVRLTADTISDYADPDGSHIARLIDACWRLGRPSGTPAPAPLAERPRPPRPARTLRERWTCGTCGTRTRLATCRCTVPDPATAPVDSNLSKPPDGNPYAGLRRWAHMLGFGGHFLTKARRYSITFRHLRDTRVTYRRSYDQDHDPTVRAAHQTDEETILIVGTLNFAGLGWHSSGDALLANTAAALARERRRVAREELAHELGTTHRAAGTLPAAA